MDLIRAILLEGEKLEPSQQSPIQITGRSDAEVYEHARLAKDAGLIDAHFMGNSSDFVLVRLTNEGHDFIEASRRDSTWEKAKEKTMSATGTLTIATLKTVLAELAQHAIKAAMPSW